MWERSARNMSADIFKVGAGLEGGGKVKEL